jgi:DNA cross-link repair 1C protein
MGKNVVYINPVTMGSVVWDMYTQSVKERLSGGDVVTSLVSISFFLFPQNTVYKPLTRTTSLLFIFQLVPLARHSHLPELQSFVSLFRPHRVVPNTLIPHLYGLDWAGMDRMFEHCLSPSRSHRLNTALIDTRSLGNDTTDILHEDEGDTALLNLVGDCATAAAERWAHDGRLRKKLDFLRGYLRGEDRALVDLILERGGARTNRKEGAVNPLDRDRKNPRHSPSDEDTDVGSNEDDERGRTAHFLFAGGGGDEKATADGSSLPVSHQADSPALQERTEHPPGTPVETIGSGSGRAMGFLTPPPCVPTKALLTPVSSIAPKAGKHQKRRLESVSPLGRRCDNALATPLGLHSPFPSSTQTDFTVSNRRNGHQHGMPLIDVNNYLECRLSTSPQGSPAVMTRKDSPQHVNQLSIHKRRVPDSKCIGNSVLSADRHEVPIPPHRLKRRKPMPQDGAVNTTAESEISHSPESRSAHRRSKQAERHAHQLECLRIGEQLSRARPDLVAPTYAARRARLLASSMRYLTREQYSVGMRFVRHSYRGANGEKTTSSGSPTRHRAMSFESVQDDNTPDWDRSLRLAEGVRADVERGRKVVLPRLICVENKLHSP